MYTCHIYFLAKQRNIHFHNFVHENKKDFMFCISHWKQMVVKTLSTSRSKCQKGNGVPDLNTYPEEENWNKTKTRSLSLLKNYEQFSSCWKWL